jgi:hypothetical protein
VDKFGGTELDAAVNIILLDDYFDKGLFQRDRFKAAIGAGMLNNAGNPSASAIACEATRPSPPCHARDTRAQRA